MFKRKTFKKIQIKRKFRDAIMRLKHMKPRNQRAAALTASNEFIRDMSAFLSKLRKRPDLVQSKKHRRILQKHKTKLRKLVHAKTSLQTKRKILSSNSKKLTQQKGGILPFLIPLIVAGIGAGGTVAAAATHAAISRA